MSPYARLIAAGVTIVLLISTVGAFLSKAFGFNYGHLAILSFLLYFGSGYFGAQLAGPGKGMLAGLILGTIDATIGWALSWAIGPGRLADTPRPGQLPAIVLTVVFTSVCLSGVGALIGHLTRGQARTAG
jgi:hypothetical protein